MRLKQKSILLLLFIATITILPMHATEDYSYSYAQQHLYINTNTNPTEYPDYKYYKNIIPKNTPLPHRYTANQFKHYFDEHGYTEQQILNQHALYVSNEFVKLAKTYSNYEETIKCLHKELVTLSRCKKFLRTLVGTYYPGLKKRINFLYNEILIEQATDANQNKTIYQKNNTFNASAFHEQISDYEILDSVYHTYLPSLATAIDKRIKAYNAIINDNEKYTTTSYKIHNDSIKLLQRYGHDTTPFTQCTGNQLQHVIHQESVDILEQINRLTPNSIIYNHQDALVDCVTSVCDYNHEGLTDKATQVADLCWTLLDYGQAALKGVALGLYTSVHDIIENPIEATVCIIAGKHVLAYQLCKVLYNVADIGITAITNFDEARTKWNNYTEPLTAIISAIQTKQTSLRDVIKGGTALVVGWKAQNKLLGGLGKFCNTIKRNSIRFAQNNISSFSIQKYLATPEGYLLRSVAKTPCTASCPNQYEFLKQWLQIKEFTSIIDTTQHGIERLIERGFNPRDVHETIKQFSYTKIQKDGAIAYIKQIQNNFNIIIFNEQTKKLVTAIKNTDQKSLAQLGKKYGWQ